MKKKICIVTGSRAEYDLLYRLMKEIQSDPDLCLQIIATGMHLSPEFGLTYKLIEADGFEIDFKVEMIISSDTPVGVAKSIGIGTAGIAEAIHNLAPNMVVMLGDRFEIFSAAQAAMVLQIPLAHLAGGDKGSGTYDNIIRDCITKMACLHFVTHEDARDRVIALGESPEQVFCFGATAVENILNIPILSRVELEHQLGIQFEKHIFLVTFHPLTMDESSSENQLQVLLSVMDECLADNSCTIIFTKSNADNGGRRLNQILAEYVKHRPKCHLFDSLGQIRYLSLMKSASLVIGNSSSGIYEAPYLGVPTVDIGSRQRGRSASLSVFRCEADRDSIRREILRALDFKFENIEMIYGDGNVSKNIIRKIKEFINVPGLAIKKII